MSAGLASTLHALGDAWLAWSAPLAVELAALAGLAWLVERRRSGLARRAWPEVRAGLWTAVLLRPLVPAGALAALAALPGGGLLGGLIPAARPGAGGGAAAPDAGFGADVSGASLVALLWLAGALALGLAFAVRTRRAARRWLDGAAPADECVRALARDAARRLGLARVPRVVVVPEDGPPGAPALVGLVRPVVALPADLVAAAHREPRARRRLRHALAHELAHVARRDPWRATAALVAALCVWWHPAAWIAHRRLAGLRELGCDVRAARALDDGPAGYRGTLLELARPLVERPERLGGALRLGGGALLFERLARLERPLPSRLRAAARPAALVVGLFACLTSPAVDLGAEVAAAPLASWLPPLDELEGCLQLRYAVHGLAGQAAARSETFPLLPTR